LLVEVFLVPLVGFVDQPLVKLFLVYSGFVFRDQQNCVSLRIESKGDTPNPAISPEPKLLHIRVLRVVERVYLRSSERRPVLSQRNERREEFILDYHGQLIELGLELGMEVRGPRHTNSMPHKA
jgi:hypothetical protein